MKPIKLSLLSIVLISSFSFCQTANTSEISASLGVETLEDFRTALSDLTTTLLTSTAPGGKITFENGSRISAYNVHYAIAVKDHWMVGATLAYQTLSRDWLVNDKVAGQDSSTAYTIAVETDYRYISKPVFQMYSGAGLGLVSVKTDFILGPNLMLKGENGQSSQYFTFQITALGFRVGKQLAGFAELGFGYKGIASAGLSYQF